MGRSELPLSLIEKLTNGHPADVERVVKGMIKFFLPYCRMWQKTFFLNQEEYKTAVIDGVVITIEAIRNGALSDDTKVKAFGNTTIRNVCAKVRRNSPPSPNVNVEDETSSSKWLDQEEVTRFWQQHSDSEGVATNEQRFSLFAKAMERLAQTARRSWEIIDARLCGKSHEEIAKELGLKNASVSREQFRQAKQRLEANIVSLAIEGMDEPCKSILPLWISGYSFEKMASILDLSDAEEAEKKFLRCKDNLRKVVGKMI